MLPSLSAIRAMWRYLGFWVFFLCFEFCEIFNIYFFELVFLDLKEIEMIVWCRNVADTRQCDGKWILYSFSTITNQN